MSLGREREDVADSILAEIGETLRALGCGCGPEAHRTTPPMMYPEWIKCVVAHRERTVVEALGPLVVVDAVKALKALKFARLHALWPKEDDHD